LVVSSRWATFHTGSLQDPEDGGLRKLAVSSNLTTRLAGLVTGDHLMTDRLLHSASDWSVTAGYVRTWMQVRLRI
jgi:hypothetical protein